MRTSSARWSTAPPGSVPAPATCRTSTSRGGRAIESSWNTPHEKRTLASRPASPTTDPGFYQTSSPTIRPGSSQTSPPTTHARRPAAIWTPNRDNKSRSRCNSAPPLDVDNGGCKEARVIDSSFDEFVRGNVASLDRYAYALTG